MQKFIQIINNPNLNKHEKLAKILKKIIISCDINQKKYYILGSYALREHREIQDLDINMDSQEFEKLKSCAHYGQIQPYNNQIRWFFDLTHEYQKFDPNTQDFSIEIFQKKPSEGFPNSEFSLDYLTKNHGLDTDKYNHQFFSLETLLRWKKTMNRPKDQSDILILEKLLNKQGGGTQGGKYDHKYIKYINKNLKY